VGGDVAMPVILENPLGVEAKFATRTSNKRNFNVETSTVRAWGTPPQLDIGPSDCMGDQ
jgi:hypothetical protein